jgi:hypothetical protein
VDELDGKLLFAEKYRVYMRQRMIGAAGKIG